ncbi:MAG: molecular chaperone DnaJ [Dehalococcoidales bacterium]|nr:molecular chaperone DnaJ [Dehalococcoidales bacterium]
MFTMNTMKRDYYEVLGTDRNADEATIKKAYRSHAMKYHPDRNPGDIQAAEHMKEINEAYAVLSDSHKRSLYDTYGHAGLESYTQEDIFRGVDFSSLFHEFGLRDFFGFGDSLFDTFFSRRATTRKEVRKGTDLRYDVKVTLEEVAFGTEKVIELSKVEECAACGGTGAKPDGLERCQGCGGTGQIVREQRSGYSVFRQISACDKCGGRGKIIKYPCEGCQGKGAINKKKEITVKIPAGADTGYSIKVTGEGKKGEDMPGDLYIVLNVEKHPTFERHGSDIYIQKGISFTTAALGGEINVPTLDDKIKLEIPEGTPTGTVFRLENRGVPHIDRHGRGDEYVIVKVVTPTNLSFREKELLKRFERLRRKSGNEPGQ